MSRSSSLATKATNGNRKVSTRTSRTDELRLILGGKTSTKTMPFLITMLLVSIIVITLVQGLVAQSGIKVEQKKKELQETLYTNSNLKVDIAESTDPDYIYKNAQSLGLKLQENVNYIYIDSSNDALQKFIDGTE